jgi:DNA-binding GntR family transcriptional regulator
MDIGTANDFIQDLQEENARLHQAIANLCNEMVVLESERDHWRRTSDLFAKLPLQLLPDPEGDVALVLEQYSFWAKHHD